MRTTPASLGPDAWRTRIEEATRAAGLEAAGLALIEVEGARGYWQHPDEPFVAASLMKVPVLGALHASFRRGELDRHETRTITMPDHTDTWRPVLKPGDSRTLEDLASLMIRTSDNVATNVLLDVLTPEGVMAWLGESGLEGLEVHRKVGGSAPMPGGAPPRNQVTARGLATFFLRLALGQLVSPDEDRRMREILEGQEDRTRIPSGLPAGVRIAHKTGETSSTCHDAGLIFLGDRAWVMVVLTRSAPLAATCRAIGTWAGAVTSGMVPAGPGSDAGSP